MTATRSQWAIGACLACLGLMIVVPPLNPLHLAPLPSFIEEWLALALGTAAVAFALRARGFRIDEVPRVVPWLVAFAALLAAQAVVRDLPYREQAVLPALFVLWAAALAWTGSSLRQSLGGAAAARALARCVLAIACVSAVIGLVQSSGIATPLDAIIARPLSPRAHGNLNQPNLLADLLALGVASAIFLRSDGALGRVAAGGAPLLLAAALVATGSRSGLVFAAWTLAWSVWWWRASPGVASRRAVRVALLFVAALALVQAVLAYSGTSTMSVTANRTVVLSPGGEGPTSLSVRRYLWLQAAYMFGHSPVLGVGPGMFAWNFFLDAPAFEGVSVPGTERFAHDFVLQLLAETGVAGCALAVIPLVAWLLANRRPGSEAWRWWCVAVVGIVLLHSLVENPLWYAHFLGPFALVLGLGDRSGYAIKRERVLRMVAPALVLAGAVSLYGAAAGYRDTIRWLHGRPDASPAGLQRSVLRPYAELLMSSVSLTPDRFVPEDVALSERLVEFMPVDLVVYRHVRMLAQAGREPEALALLDRAVSVFPHALDHLRRELESARGSPITERLLQRLNTRVGN
jgi:O-antigen ligase/polysaccharide polymerase Wzy-like membrane protein